MARQFQAPQIGRGKTPLEALTEPISQSIQTLPELYTAYQQRRKQQEIQDLQLEMQKRELLSKYGTGAPSPMNPGMATPNVTPDNLTPEEQMSMGTDYTMPTPTEESPEQKLGRLGSEGYKILNPQQYGSYVIGADGKPQFLSLPSGYKPSPGVPMPTPVLNAEGKQVATTTGKPTVLPAPKETTEDKAKGKIEAEKPKALGSLNNTLREYDNMIKGAESLKNDPGLGGASGLLLGRAKATDSQRRINANLDTLKAKTLLGVLASIKELSKTGASGFGALSELEGENIRNSISSLDRTQSTSDLKTSLDRFIEEMKARKQNLKDTFTATYGDGGFSSHSSVPQIGENFQGAKVKKVTRIE